MQDANLHMYNLAAVYTVQSGGRVLHCTELDLWYFASCSQKVRTGGESQTVWEI